MSAAESVVRTGRCLCGAVTYRLGEPPADVLHCHCENCRRTTGNFVAAARIATAAIEVTDSNERLTWYRLPYARYGFCRECGSTLFWVGADNEASTSLMVGSLDSADGLRLGGVWFAAEAQSHHLLPGHVPHFAGNGDD